MPGLPEHEDRWLDGLLQHWAEAEREKDPSKHCPTILRLWLHEMEGGPLGNHAAHVASCQRCQRRFEIIRKEIAKVPPAKEQSWRIRVPVRYVASGVIAVAACLVLGILFLWSNSGDGGAALAQDLREFGYAPPPLMAGFWHDPLAGDALLQTEQTVADTRVELARILSTGDRSVADPWESWTKLYRSLKALGRWQEALDEALKFTAYAKLQDELPDRYSMYYTALSDVGGIYLALGSYESAAQYHREALSVVRDYQEWFHHTGRSSDPRPHALDAALACSLPPYLWTLSGIASLQGDQQSVWAYHQQAEVLLISFFQKDAAFRGLSVPINASLYDLCSTLKSAADQSFETPAIIVRQHLLHESMLLRVERKLELAATRVSQVRTIPYYARADTFRQEFSVPLEEMKIAIGRGDWSAALAAADETEKHTDSFRIEGYPELPPIGILARAELTFLRGVALAGVAPADPEALRLIESAIAVVNQAATSLPEAQREPFLIRFKRWIEVSEFLRRPGQKQLSDADHRLIAPILASLAEETGGE